MPKYIEQEAALSAVDCGNLHKGIVDALQENIKDIPAADVVEVVRCSECEYWDRNDEARLDKGCYFCSCYGGYTRPTFYCATGERKGGGE